MTSLFIMIWTHAYAIKVMSFQIQRVWYQPTPLKMHFHNIFKNDLGIHNFQIREPNGSQEDTSVNEHVDSHQHSR
jgi:hypothetical protein